MPRPKHCRFVSSEDISSCRREGTKFVTINSDELEALKLNSIDLLHQTESADRMGISRATYGRILKSCLKKVAKALLSGSSIEITEVSWVVRYNKKKELDMKKIIAMPVLENAGDAKLSEHFGHAPYFAVVEGETTKFIENRHEGGCSDVVNKLKENNVEILLVKGIGGRPKIACDQLGIKVFRAAGNSVGECVSAWTEGANETNVSCHHSENEHGHDEGHGHGKNCHGEH